MVYDGNLEGRTVRLTPVTEEDAPFILEMRQNDEITRFFPRLDITVEEQAAWIRTQREREGDYYFLIRSRDGRRLGTVSVYDIEGDSAEIGRLASLGNSVENVEAYLLAYRFAFETLGLAQLIGRVRPENKKVKSLDERMGFVFDPQLVNDRGFDVVFGKVTRERHAQCAIKMWRLIEKASE